MGLKEQLMADYKEAMKNHDSVKKETVNLVRAAIKQHEVDQREEITDDADIVKIIKKQVKMRTDALADFANAGRDDMTEAYKKEIAILQAYLPEEMSTEQIAEKGKSGAADLGAESHGTPRSGGVAFLPELAGHRQAPDHRPSHWPPPHRRKRFPRQQQAGCRDRDRSRKSEDRGARP